MITASQLPKNTKKEPHQNGDLHLARKLRGLRMDHMLTLRQVAKATGLSIPYLSLLENAHTTPVVSKLAVLAAFYETSLDELAGHMVEEALSHNGKEVPRTDRQEQAFVSKSSDKERI